jgi:hypothetical protein
MMQLSSIPLNHEHLERLRKVRDDAIFVYFGDDPGSEIACLGTAVIPDEALYVDYVSDAHDGLMRHALHDAPHVAGIIWIS